MSLDRRRFVAELDGQPGKIVYRLRNNKIAFLHTEVPDACGRVERTDRTQGRGAAAIDAPDGFHFCGER